MAELIAAYVRVRPGAAASTVFRAGLGPFRRRWQAVCVDGGQYLELRNCDRLDVETDDPFAGKPKDAPHVRASQPSADCHSLPPPRGLRAPLGGHAAREDAPKTAPKTAPKRGAKTAKTAKSP